MCWLGTLVAFNAHLSRSSVRKTRMHESFGGMFPRLRLCYFPVLQPFFLASARRLEIAMQVRIAWMCRGSKTFTGLRARIGPETARRTCARAVWAQLRVPMGRPARPHLAFRNSAYYFVRREMICEFTKTVCRALLMQRTEQRRQGASCM